GSPPYHGVVTPGWTLDEKGQAMSKSRGNDVDPVDIANRLGGEIVRLWVASVDFREDVVGSEQLMQRVAESYRKIRNSLFRYILSNLHDFDPRRHAVPFDKMEALDQYMLRQTASLSADVTRWYDEFAFHKIYHRVNDFCVVELSAFYFDVLKDRLYTYAPDSRARQAAQTAIWRIGEALVRLLAPIMSFTCDEVWQYLPAQPERLPSVHLAKFPTAADILGDSVPVEDAAQSEDWKILLAVRTEVLKALEEARQSKLIGGANLEAHATITAAEPVFKVLARYQDGLRYLFIVSAVTLEPVVSGNGTGGVSVRVSKAEGKKCERCWNYSIHVGEDTVYPTVCERCSAVLKELGG
ncbi:MAG TPA: class I tRNA ligase family protein, partial [Terriglobales bacterium]|nr:class I tRNA ligase family protein [Terriglobales bacterium]